MLIGRHSQADLRLALPEVSRRHCRFLFGQGQWQVLDLNSLNGVLVNGQPIRQTTVRAGDLIRIGGFTFAVEMGTAGTEPVAAGTIRGVFPASPTAERESEEVQRRLAS
jgi:adenylate cyclase